MTATESQIMTNIIAAVPAMTTVGEKHARHRVDVCRIVAPATPGAGHLLRLTKLHAHDRVTRITYLGDADAQMDDVDVGIYTPSPSTTDPVVIDANGLASSDNLSAGSATGLDVLGTGLSNFTDFGKALWEYCAGGPSTEPAPGTEYEICADSASDVAGSNQVWIIEYTTGD